MYSNWRARHKFANAAPSSGNSSSKRENTRRGLKIAKPSKTTALMRVGVRLCDKAGISAAAGRQFKSLRRECIFICVVLVPAMVQRWLSERSQKFGRTQNLFNLPQV